MGRLLVYCPSKFQTVVTVSEPMTSEMPLWGVKTPQPKIETRSDFGGVKSEIAAKKCFH